MISESTTRTSATSLIAKLVLLLGLIVAGLTALEDVTYAQCQGGSCGGNNGGGDIGGFVSRIGGLGVRVRLPRTGLNIGGVGFQVGSQSEALIEDQVCNVLGLTEGRFAALVMVVSGLIAIVSAATGAYRMALATLIVGIGSYILPNV
ncbi:MAG: hypothetical protein IT290_04050, partial [Deltaproteobacteria bacterium]|nr:hypothetical protein [Deltaproteobacteria bacterium]